MTNESTLVDVPLFPLLIIRAGGQVVKKVTLQAELSIGRAEDNDLQLMDPKVSRYHARVQREGATYVLTDLDSANGTRVNGVRLTASHTLRHGERIAIGDTELTYEEPGRSLQDTITAIGPPPVVRERAKEPSPPPPTVAAPPQERNRGLVIGLAAAGALALLALIVAAALLLAPGLSERIRLGGQPTPTGVEAVETPTSPAAIATPVAAPTTVAATSTPLVSGVDPQEMHDLLVQAEALARRSKFEEATVIYQDLVGRAPDDARPEIGWAWALILDDEGEQALEHARRAWELDPASAEAAAVLARAYIETGDKEQALALAQEAVQLDAGNAQTHAVLAEAYLLNGENQAAVDEADLALVQDINNADAHRIRGWLYYAVTNDMGRAAGELQIAAGLQPELWMRRHDLGVLLFEAEDYTTAIMAFQDALGIRPKARTYTAIGGAYYRLGQYDQAKASAQQALAAGAEDAAAQGLLAASLAHLGRCDEAAAPADQALALDPAQPLALEATDLCQEGKAPPAPSPTTAAAQSSPTPATGAKPKPPPPAALSGRIAFPVWNAQEGRYDTYVANADGSGRRLVVEGMHQPAFRPDGKWLAVNGERHEHMDLFIVHPNGSGLKEISKHIEDALPWWSPDGQSIAFSSTMHGDKQSRVYIIDKVPLEGTHKEEGRPLNFGPDDVRGEYPTWTADNRIVYKGCDLTVMPAKCGLFIMSASPGAQPFTQLTDNGEDTAPAAHGTKIAFMSNRDGNWEIYIMNNDGSGLKRLTRNAAHDGLPAWSPDGKTLAFVSNQGGGWAIWAMSPDGSNRRKLFDIGGQGLAFDWEHERISWGP